LERIKQINQVRYLILINSFIYLIKIHKVITIIYVQN